MTDAPERIWALADRRKHWQDEPPKDGQHTGHWTPYTRTDLHTAALAERDAVIADLVEALKVAASPPSQFIGPSHENVAWTRDVISAARAALSRAEKAMKG